MSNSGTSPNGNTAPPSFQRLGIALGTLLIVILTVVAAIFLTLQDLPSETRTPVAQASPTFLPPTPTSPTTITAVPAAPSATSTALPVSGPSPTPTLTLEPSTPTLPPPTTTNTPPPPPTYTPTPVIIAAPPTSTPPPPLTPPELPQGAVCHPPGDWVPYVVQLGDTLNSLALRTNSSVYDLQQVNCLKTFTLEIGQTIYLPFTPPTPTITYTPTPLTPTPTPTRTGTPTPTPRPPEIFGNVPDSGVNTQEVTIAVQGRNFQPDEEGFRVELRTGGTKVSLELGNLKTTSSFEAIVPAGLPVGTYDLWVINPDDQFDIRSDAYKSLP